MTVIAEAFGEIEWGDPEIAQERRDARLAQLEAQGLICRAELLYRVMDGRRVYVVTAESPEPQRQEGYRNSKPARSGDRGDRAKRRSGKPRSESSRGESRGESRSEGRA
jgi:hypothetical protein